MLSPFGIIPGDCALHHTLPRTAPRLVRPTDTPTAWVQFGQVGEIPP
ncbi:predicted protein [Streptomyces filamentosus NRRL 15998]|uniref:Predicted protein n=1 Tax=Streptomyces filamentosus NRRL 15998 TaxID=457431 RepID=D6AMI3_STRFL|nr:predicted protein [Streptomyces filamentosus NRRL 15998]